ncbi:solute carrier family 22 member 15 isoform X2 [Nematostella vectensis]|uniref:solute carrier family 22 member 15 isoform X2 n=1 Tax=Nematostella vectensis TaxID=45351 RepID=UPI0020770566|nr:solute carrier family 22 member 15 isoform X2 [Nematostella vectensis]
MDIDKILSSIGGFGFFQKRNSFILGLVIFIATFQTVLIVFVGMEPPWKCAQDSTTCTLNGTFSSGDENYDSRCSMNRSDWEFTSGFTSIVSEWDLICGKAAMASLAQSILFIGWIPGAFIIGKLSDMFGRTRMLFPSIAVVAVASLSCSFAQHLWLYLVLRAIVGFFEGGVYIVLYVLSTEFVGPAHRSLAGTLNWVFFTLSLITLDGLAYGLHDWRHLSIAVSVPALPLFFFWWLVPESCRWQLVNNRCKEARQTLEHIAKLNGKNLPSDVMPAINNVEEEKLFRGGILDLFKPRQQLKQTLILWFSWLTNAMVYYGVTLSAGVLGGSLYLNFLLASLVELPGNLFSIWFMNLAFQVGGIKFYGRKRALIIGLILAALFCTFVSVFPKKGPGHYQVIKIISAVLGKFCISISFCTIYVTSTELLPTVIRNIGMGSMAVFDQLGASLAPFIILLFDGGICSYRRPSLPSATRTPW